MQQGINEAQAILSRKTATPHAEMAAPSVEELAQEIMITKKKPRLRKT